MSSSGVPVLEARGLGKDFGRVVAVGEVSLQLFPGEVVALAGENGSGKSTLARMLAGSVRPERGTVALRGEPMQFTRPGRALDVGVALVTQEPLVIPAMSVAENVMLHTLRRGFRWTRRRGLEEQAAAALAAVGSSIDPSRRFETLGPGESELVELAKALALEPAVLILDEVTTRLPDPEEVFAVIEHHCRARRMAVLLITHRLREITRMADRAVVLRDGALVGELPRAELDDHRLSSMMVGRELDDLYAKADVPLGGRVLDVRGLVTDRFASPIDLSVAAGEIVGIAGLVGCGRTEVLETIAGARRAVEGDVRLQGDRLSLRSPAEGIAAGVGFVPDDRWAQGLLPHQSVVANLALSSHRTLHRTDRAGDRRRAERAAERLNIKMPSPDAPVASLSGGNAQKVLLARVLDRNPPLLLLSEPTRGVDIGAKAEIYRIVDDLVARGTSIVVSSSDLLELIGLCDRILVMHDGELVGELSRADATEEAVTLLMGGSELAA